jgi:hypothetical protein
LISISVPKREVRASVEFDLTANNNSSPAAVLKREKAREQRELDGERSPHSSLSSGYYVRVREAGG